MTRFSISKPCLLWLTVLNLGLLGCSRPEDVAGSSSETVVGNTDTVYVKDTIFVSSVPNPPNLRITGTALYANQQPAASATFKLRKNNFLKKPQDILLTKSVASLLDGQVDSKGSFQIDSVQVGSYTLEVDDGDSSGALLHFEVKYQDTLTHLSSVELTPKGNIRGRIHTLDSSNLAEILRNTYIQVLGVDKGSYVDTAGYFNIEGLPTGRYTIRAQVDIPYLQTAELGGILVEENDTTNLQSLPLRKVLTHNVTSLVPDGLIAYWPFNEGSVNQIEDVVGQHSGIAQGGPTWQEGISESSLKMDGINDVVWVPNLYLNEDFTISFWAYLTNEIDQEDVVIGHNNENNINFFMGKIRLFKGVFEPGQDVIISKTTSLPNTWYHYTFTRNNNQLNLYINGVLDTTGTSAVPFPINVIGKGHGGYLEGQLDEVRVYNRALTPSEIDLLYQDID